jgi:hypothetical protein
VKLKLKESRIFLFGGERKEKEERRDDLFFDIFVNIVSLALFSLFYI